MTELQSRILMVMRNIGQAAKPIEIQQRGNIAKPVDVIQTELVKMKQQAIVVSNVAGTVWMPAKAEKNPVAHVKQKRRTSEECRRLVFEYFDANPKHSVNKASNVTGLSYPTVEVYHKAWLKRKNGTAPAQSFAELKRPEVPPEGESDVGAIEDQVKREKNVKGIDADGIHDALGSMYTYHQFTPVDEFDLKIEVLTDLQNLLDPRIKPLLASIESDLKYLNSLSASAPV